MKHYMIFNDAAYPQKEVSASTNLAAARKHKRTARLLNPREIMMDDYDFFVCECKQGDFDRWYHQTADENGFQPDRTTNAHHYKSK